MDLIGFVIFIAFLPALWALLWLIAGIVHWFYTPGDHEDGCIW